MKNIALILASGTGTRSGLNQPKQFFEVGGKTLLEYSVEAFNGHKDIDKIIIVSHPDFLDKTTTLTQHFSKVSKVICGGETRQESSYKGVFSVVAEDNSNILIHDAVRAFITKDIIDACLYGLNEHDAICTAIASTDTILEIDDSGKIVNVPERKRLKCAQTPQGFKLGIIKQAHELVKKQNISVTDDCGLILSTHLCEIYVVDGTPENRKITYPNDLEFARWIYKK